MALSPQQLQKKRAKKVAKRRTALAQAPRLVPVVAANTPGNWRRGLGSPIHEVCVNEDIFTGGMGSLIFCRRNTEGHHVLAVFLLDTWCLGVKNVIQSVMTEAEYSLRRRQIAQSHSGSMREISPATARKLVEDLVAWSRELGFPPCSDYSDAARIFGDVERDLAQPDFPFGNNGKPFYIRGPRETIFQSRKIIDQLQRKCGVGGFDYMVSMDNPSPQEALS